MAPLAAQGVGDLPPTRDTRDYVSQTPFGGSCPVWRSAAEPGRTGPGTTASGAGGRCLVANIVSGVPGGGGHGRVITALYRDPGRNWTVAELAAEMGTSHSVFAKRFLEVTGVTSVRYVTELRIRLAAQWIGRERLPIETAAHRLGYGSEAALSRAFKRIMGYSPGASRSAEL